MSSGLSGSTPRFQIQPKHETSVLVSHLVSGVPVVSVVSVRSDTESKASNWALHVYIGSVIPYNLLSVEAPFSLRD